MPELSTVTQKGQVTIPVSIRRRWGLKSNHKVMFVEKGKVVEVQPAVDFFKLRGSVKSRKKYSDRVTDKSVGEYIAKSYGQETANKDN